VTLEEAVHHAQRWAIAGRLLHMVRDFGQRRIGPLGNHAQDDVPIGIHTLRALVAARLARADPTGPAVTRHPADRRGDTDTEAGGGGTPRHPAIDSVNNALA
jgi:hypothetical protein